MKKILRTFIRFSFVCRCLQLSSASVVYNSFPQTKERSGDFSPLQSLVKNHLLEVVLHRAPYRSLATLTNLVAQLRMPHAIQIRVSIRAVPTVLHGAALHLVLHVFPFNLPSPLGLTIYYGLMCGVSTCFQRFFGFFLLLRGFVVYNYVTWQKKRAAAIPPFSPWRNNHKSPLTRKKSNKPNQKGEL